MANFFLTVGYAIMAIFGYIYQEQPKYQVVKKYEKFEVREYPDLLVANIEDPSDHTAFLTLANYFGLFLFPKNEEKQSIDMTTPLLGDEVNLSMIIPRKFNENNVPQPINKKIHIQKITKRKIAAFEFQGNYSRNNVKDIVQSFKKLLDSQNIKYDEQYIFARYNPEWTLPKLRKNEIWLSVE